MQKQRIMSFDIGIKNMAYCIFETNDLSQNHTVQLTDWNILNLMEKENPSFFCNCSSVKERKPKTPKKEKKTVKLENFFIDISNCLPTQNATNINSNKLCGKIAKYRKNENFYCEKHAKNQTTYILPKKQYTISQLKKSKIEELNLICSNFHINIGENTKKNTKKEILEKLESFFKINCLETVVESKKHTAGDTDLITIGKNMKHLLNIVDEIDSITHVIIENQISPIANRMKTVQGMLAQYFIMKNSEIKIDFVSSMNKLKEFSKNGEKIEKDKNKEKEEEKTEKQKYSQHKKDGVFYTNQILEKNPSLDIWKKIFDESKKKDDLADCFLQGIWYLKTKMNIIIDL